MDEYNGMKLVSEDGDKQRTSFLNGWRTRALSVLAGRDQLAVNLLSTSCNGNELPDGSLNAVYTPVASVDSWHGCRVRPWHESPRRR